MASALAVVLAALAGAAAARPAGQPDGVPDRLVFPIVGPAAWTDDFGAPRAQGGHEGNDILSDWRAPVVAVEAGKVRVYTKSARAGCMLYLYGKSGTTYLYIHLNEDLTPKNDGRGGCKAGVAYAEGLRNGDHVRAGALLGYVGSSGDAGATNHLHFELHPDDGNAVSPFRWLKRAERLLFVPPAAGVELLADDEASRLTLTGTVTKVEEDAGAPAPDGVAPEPDGPVEPPPAASDSPPQPVSATAAPDEVPASSSDVPVIGRAAGESLLRIRVSSVELSSGGSWDVERNVTLTVPADAVVERRHGARTKNASLASAEKGERVTVTTDAVGMTLEFQRARPGRLSAAHILLRGDR